MSKPQPVEQFLTTLHDQLRALGAADVDDLVNEMRSHLADQLAEDPERSESDVVESMGDPRELASALLAGRASGASESAWPGQGAHLSRRVAAWAVDALWALWVPALLWPIAAIGVVLMMASLDPVGLILGSNSVPIVLVLAISLVPVGWFVTVLVRAANGRRIGRPTIGTRATRLTPWNESGPVVWVDADSAPPGVALAPVPHRGRARLALVVALVLTLIGALWVPAVAWRQQGTSKREVAQSAENDARITAYTAGGESRVRALYSAALAGKSDIINGGFTARDTILQDFVDDLEWRGVTDYRLGFYDVEPVAMDPADSERATVAIPVIESAPDGEVMRLVHFTVVDPQNGSSGADQTWTLESIDAPTPAPVVN